MKKSNSPPEVLRVQNKVVRAHSGFETHANLLLPDYQRNVGESRVDHVQRSEDALRHPPEEKNKISFWILFIFYQKTEKTFRKFDQFFGIKKKSKMQILLIFDTIFCSKATKK